MRLAIPNTPRKVSLHQVPGALARLGLVVAVAAALAAGVFWVSTRAGAFLSSQREFFARAIQVPGRVRSVSLPPTEQREGAVAQLAVLYQHPEGFDRSAAGVSTWAVWAEGLGPGAELALLVDPLDPDRPRDERYERDREGLHRFVPYGVGVGVLLALLLIGLELRRAVQRELQPLRGGMLVWLTPDEELPETRAETVFAASYFRQDVKIQVRARARPGRAPVRNGEKVLAAVVPSRPTWVRVIDEDLAHHLGWFINS